MNERLKEFKQFESDDQAFWDKVIGGDEPEVPTPVREGTTRLRAGERVVVHNEIVESLWEEDFTTVEDQHIIEDLRDRLRLYGVDPGKAEEMLKQAQKSPLRRKAPSEPFIIQPQRELEEARKRLNEQAKRLAKILLNHVELDMNGTEMMYKYKSLKVSGRSNYVSALMMVNEEINKRLGKERGDASAEDFQKILGDLENLLQPLVRRVPKSQVRL